jgi:hypothetical protein
MNKQTSQYLPPNQMTEAAYAASRQLWLAGLGAAVVTRDWVQHEAGPTFKKLVREGTAIESRAIRYVGDKLETSVTRANGVWKQGRRKVESKVKQAAVGAVALAQQVLPRSLPKIELPLRSAKPKAPARRVTRAKKTVRAGKAKVARKVRKTVKAAPKRG